MISISINGGIVLDIKIFINLLQDKHFPDYEKMQHKYSADFDAFLQTLQQLYQKNLPLSDFGGKPMALLETASAVKMQTVKMLLREQDRVFGMRAAEEEILATCAIENIDFSRDSVRNILKGYAPVDEQENRILGLKNGLAFIADASNRITEENLYRLYCMTVGDFLDAENRLLPGCFYRHDTVYVVSDHVDHAGLDSKKVPQYMNELFAYINADDDTDDLTKAAVIHFYFAFVHPYFDGNGRMARLLHLWFLVQKGYRSVLFVPFSNCIEKSRKAYYDAFSLVEKNRRFMGSIDVTPFVLYFNEFVYNKMTQSCVGDDVMAMFGSALLGGEITQKEKMLWQFVLSFYGTSPFSTKQLEKDCANAAYATIRSFVIKFEKLGLLTRVSNGTRTKYKVTQ